MNEPTRLSGLRDYVRVLRQQRWLLLLIPVVFVGASLAYSSREEKVYRAQASIQFQEPSSEVDALGLGVGPRLTPEERSAIGAETVLRSDIRRAVERRLKLPSLGASVSASTANRTNLVVIRVSSVSPRRAAVVANAFAAETARVLRRAYRRDVRSQLRAVRPAVRRLERLPDPVVRAEQIQLEGRLRALERLGEPVKLARPATVPASPVSPRPVRNALLALIAGLTLALIAAFARDALDRRLRDTGDVARAAGLPVVGRVRHSSLGLRSLASGPNRTLNPDLEAVRIMLTNLEYLDRDIPGSRILVTSALPEEGKSTVAFLLAAAAAMAGRRTLLIECDLRRPVLATRLSIDEAPGVSDYLNREASLSEVRQQLAISTSGAHKKAEQNGDGEVSSLSCITAGSPVSRPAELLDSSRVGGFMGAAQAGYDVVVLDSSPVLPVVDTLKLVPHVDRIVLCARAGRTTAQELKAARDALERLPLPATGVAVTGVRKSDELDYGYYQGYAAERRPASKA